MNKQASEGTRALILSAVFDALFVSDPRKMIFGRAARLCVVVVVYFVLFF